MTADATKHHDGRPSEYMASYENFRLPPNKSKGVKESWLQKLDDWTFTDRGVFEITQPARGRDAAHTIHNAPYKKKLDSSWKTRHWGTLQQQTYDAKMPNPGNRNDDQRNSRPPLKSKQNFNTVYRTEFKGGSQSEPSLKPKGSKQIKTFEEWRNPPKQDEWKITDRGIWELVNAKNQPVADGKNQKPKGFIDPDWKNKSSGSLYRTMYTQKTPNPVEKNFGSQTKQKDLEPDAGKYLPHGGYVSDYRGHFLDFRPKSVPNIKETKQNRSWLQAQSQESWKCTDRGIWEQLSPTGENLTRVSDHPIRDDWKMKHWASLSRTQYCHKIPFKVKKHPLKSAAWLCPDHPHWKDKPKTRAPVKGDTEYGSQFEMPQQGWENCPPLS